MQEVFEKIIYELDKSSDYYECEEQGREHVYMVDLTDAIEIVKQAAAEYNGGWIPCSEQLPECTIETCNGVLSSNVVEVTTVDKDGNLDVCVDFLIGNMWSCKMNGEKVIAWKPLPEPYKPKGE